MRVESNIQKSPDIDTSGKYLQCKQRHGMTLSPRLLTTITGISLKISCHVTNNLQPSEASLKVSCHVKDALMLLTAFRRVSLNVSCHIKDTLIPLTDCIGISLHAGMPWHVTDNLIPLTAFRGVSFKVPCHIMKLILSRESHNSCLVMSQIS